MSRHKKLETERMRQMALIDWVKQAIFDAMKIWIDDHEDELSELIVKSLSDRIEIKFIPSLNVKLTEGSEEENDAKINGQPSAS